MLDWGIRAVIAPSFGDIHYANEIQNGMLPAILAGRTLRHAARATRRHNGGKH